jgi:hypothetical protein
MVVELPLRDEGSTVAFGEADMHGRVAGTIPLPMTRLRHGRLQTFATQRQGSSVVKA